MSIRRLSYLFLAVLLLVAVWYFYPSSKIKITNYPSSGTDIIAFGDSLIVGAGATNENDFVSILSDKIGQKIINLGVSGDTTADGLARVGDLDRYKPKVVLLLLGGNDHLKRVPIETTFENLEKLIQNIHSRGAIVLLLGVRGNLFGDKFASEFEKLRDKHGTAYVPDVLKGLFGNSEFMEDAIHPNEAGNRIIADRVYPVLLPLIQ